MTVIKMTSLELIGKRVLIRSDLNVPIKNGIITSDARIRAALPTINAALQKGARVMVTSHLGNPREGEYNAELSLKWVVDYFEKRLSIPVRLADHYLSGIDVEPGELVVLENVRFNPGEKDNDEVLAKKYAELCDVFVMDAFGTAHRAQASTHGIAKFASIACAGPLLLSELESLSYALDNPMRPLVSIVGGSKVSTKLTVLNALSKLSDSLIVGGGIANTFIAAQGYSIGKSLYEADLLTETKSLLEKRNVEIPTDVRVATEYTESAIATIKYVDDIKDNEWILDFGETTLSRLEDIIKHANTIIWNGPIGVFEFPSFRKGTERIARAIAKSEAFSLVGGGDTLAAVDCFGVAEDISYISTGGGAFLKFIEGKKLPAVAILEERSKGSRASASPLSKK